MARLKQEQYSEIKYEEVNVPRINLLGQYQIGSKFKAINSIIGKKKETLEGTVVSSLLS
jgi:hypothetical protein